MTIKSLVKDTNICTKISNVWKKDIVIKSASIGEAVAIISSTVSSALWLTEDEDVANDVWRLHGQLGDKCLSMRDVGDVFSPLRHDLTKQYFDVIIALYDMLKNKSGMIICPVSVLSLPLPSKESFVAHILTLAVGSSYDLGGTLTSSGYRRVDHIESVGEYSVHGDIIDIWGIGDEYVLRVDNFGDEIESMYHIDGLTMERKDSVQNVDILPATLVFFDKNDDEILKKIAHALSRLRTQTNTKASDLLLETSRNIELRSAQTDVYMLALFNNGTRYDILDYVHVDRPRVIYREYRCGQNIIANAKNIKSKFLTVFGAVLAELMEDAIDTVANTAVLSKGHGGKQIVFENFDLGGGIDVIDVKSRELINYLTKFAQLVSDARSWIMQGRAVVLALKSEDTLLSIKGILDEMNVSHSTKSQPHKIQLTTWSYDENIVLDDVVVVGSKNFAHKKRLVKSKKSATTYIPTSGDYVVHEVHGIGRCEGVTTITNHSAQKDYYKIIYASDTALYVPCENADMLSLYMSQGHTGVRLSKIGGKDFAIKTAKAMESIKDMAKELISLYSERYNKTRQPYPLDDYLYTQFESTFEYNETPDQLQAIADVAADMHSGNIMDRLICGDVGFGKTEVAYRGIFRAILSGKQVAFLAPTTVLSLQHYMNGIERFRDFGIKVEMLNRFRTKLEVSKILEELKSGQIQVLCGTHRLLSRDVIWSDLGLLVLDEEQRFGVKAKETIKQLKSSVDVLTLTATPIPRTLNLAMMKIRDISILNTPPINRKPIKTFVMPYSVSNVVEAIIKERNRDGQVLIVCNDIDKLYLVANELRKYTDESTVIDVAHGQMPEAQLEDAVKRLYERSTHIFVSTTIIENGIDLPNANTLIVLDSQMLGLSQMYQLRGRVGRCNLQAYAHFTYPEGYHLTTEATERLNAISVNTELGSGLKLAMRDLQIRGAGDLLGSQQSGHIANIGYDMYIRLLEAATKELRGEKVKARRDIKLDIAISARLPEEYVQDEVERLKVYNLITAITTPQSRQQVLERIKALYGAVPAEVSQLATLTYIRSLASPLHVQQIVLNSAQCNIRFYSDVCDHTALAKCLVDLPFASIKSAPMPIINIDIGEMSLSSAQALIIRVLTNIEKA